MFETSADWKARLEYLQSKEWEVRTDFVELNRDQAPGYYVSARNDEGKYRLAEGPFHTHVEALVAVRGVSDAWQKADHRAFWYAWGTAKVGNP